MNYIADWDKSIKFFSDAGIFEKMTVILTGSDSEIIRTAMKHFAGRRGLSDKINFIFHPLKVNEKSIVKAQENSIV
ncbi:hypothetical protein OMAG_001309 [Candidatus Omnitrophus magneticus]|uniref:Uncharacterized protein n=1 Tax=Candidatus Omnitrophus magneticus TaxID=1609969 RepID=A0A0F0CNK1_9BACT|nr:hypothetical protein OMAG_001309 [Candidatus Omnitrophus magneticus]